MPEYLKSDIAKILKKPSRTIEFWTSSGLVVPDIEPSQGKGKARVYSGRNLLEFGMIDIMARVGVSLDTIRYILDVLRQGFWIPDPDPWEKDIGEYTEEEIKKWKEKHRVQLKYFWTSPAMGVSQELLFISQKWISRDNEVGNRVAFHELKAQTQIFTLPDYLPIMRHFHQASPAATIIWLGAIKIGSSKLVLG